MVREFSEEKRDEIFAMLDIIDNKEWESFKDWSKRKVLDCGDWAERLEIYKHTEYVDKYHQEVLDINNRTREQVNAVFENVAEIDARYAGLMRECQEEIKEQIKTIQTMTEFMRSMNGGNINVDILNKENINENGIRRVKKKKELEEHYRKPIIEIDIRDLFEPGFTAGQRILELCLREHDITDQDKINRVLEWIMENDCMMVLHLSYAYREGDYNGQDAEAMYAEIIQGYNDYQLGLARDFFVEYVAGPEYTGLYDWGEVVFILQEHNPDMLIRFYETDNVDEKTELFNSLIGSYNEYRIEQATVILKGYLGENGFIDIEEQQRILDEILEIQPHMLIDLYIASCNDNDGVTNDICKDIINFYNIISNISEEDVETTDQMYSLSTCDILARMIYQEQQNPANNGQNSVLWATINRYFSDENFTMGRESTIRNILLEGGFDSINVNNNNQYNGYHPDYDSEGWENAKLLAAILYSQIGEENADNVDEESIREAILSSYDIYGNHIENVIGDCDSFYAVKGDEGYYNYFYVYIEVFRN